MNRTLLAAAAVLLFAAGAQAQSASWSLDPAHSRAGFTARHLGFAKVRGEFKKFTATSIEADTKTGKITKLEAEADARSVDTGVDKRDEDLRSDHFFAADKYPKVKFVLKSIKWKGKAFTAVVSLTMRDVTKDVKLSGELLGLQKVDFGRGPQLHAGYEATGTINRKDFHLNFSGLAEGISIVADDVELDLELEMSTPVATPGAAASAAKPAPATAPTAAATPAARPAAPMAAAPAAKPGAAPAAAGAKPAAKPAAAPAMK